MGMPFFTVSILYQSKHLILVTMGWKFVLYSKLYMPLYIMTACINIKGCKESSDLSMIKLQTGESQ
jgi:hypothetical protein